MAILNNTGIRAGASGAGDTGYQIAKSLRFNKDDSAKLSRTFSSAGDQEKFTLSFWFKNCDAGLTNSKMLFCLDNGGNSQLELYEGRLATQFYDDVTGSTWYVSANTSTTHLFRDPSAWYHIVLSIDTTAGSGNADRQKIYINGEQLTLTFTTAWAGVMTGNVKGWNTADEHFIGMRGSSYGGNWMVAEYNFIDGQALDASSFGEFHADTGEWVAKEFSGTYATAEVDGSSSPHVLVAATPNADATIAFLNSNPSGSSYPVIQSSQVANNTVKVKFDSAQSGVTSIKFRGGGYASSSTYTLKVNDTQIGGTHSTASLWAEVEHTISSTAITSIEITGNDGFALGQLKFNSSLVSGTASFGTLAIGSNSFYLKFDDIYDDSGTLKVPDNSTNSNEWTATNLTVSDGSNPENIDVLTDTPTSFDDGGNGTGNYATWNPLRSLSTFKQGNLSITSHSSGTYHTTPTTLGMTSGKWYCEMEPSATGGTNNAYGIMNDTTNTNTYLGATTGTDSSMGLWDNGGTYRNGAYTNASYCSAFQTGGEIIGLAFDVDNGTLKFYINGVDKGNAWTDIPAGTWHFCVTTYQTTTTHITLNCGQRAFAYTPPSGFKALNTYNLPDPAIANPKKHFDVITYTGDSSDTAGNQQDITGLAFEPGMIWLKKRTASTYHWIFDQVRGAKYISPSSEGIEYADDGIHAWNSDGVTLEYTTGTELITDEATYVGWTWKAGTTDSISAGGLNSSLYDQSADWSSTSTLTTPGGAFDGTDMGGSGNATYSSSGETLTTSAITIASKLEIYTNRTHTGATDGTKVTINSTAYYDKALASTGWSEVDLSGATLPLTTSGAILIEDEGGSASGLWGVRVDGKILVDDDVTPDSVPTIASTYRADTDVGFSIVKYTGTATNPSSIGHGLNAEPAMIWVKRLEGAVTPWVVYHKDIGPTKNLFLTRPDAATVDATLWNNAYPTSTVWYTQDAANTNSAHDFIAYCWSEVEGYSKFGSYTGTGLDPGPFVYCGFKPAFLMIKRTDTFYGGSPTIDTDWIQYDGKVQPNEISFSHSTSWPYSFMQGHETSLGTNDEIDFVSNGFKLRSNGAWNNDTATATHVFAAWAESPFKYANAR